MTTTEKARVHTSFFYFIYHVIENKFEVFINWFLKSITFCKITFGFCIKKAMVSMATFMKESRSTVIVSQ